MKKHFWLIYSFLFLSESFSSFSEAFCFHIIVGTIEWSSAETLFCILWSPPSSSRFHSWVYAKCSCVLFSEVWGRNIFLNPPTPPPLWCVVHLRMQRLLFHITSKKPNMFHFLSFLFLSCTKPKPSESCCWSFFLDMFWSLSVTYYYGLDWGVKVL